MFDSALVGIVGEVLDRAQVVVVVVVVVVLSRLGIAVRQLG
jgi:hypothetical protein